MTHIQVVSFLITIILEAAAKLKDCDLIGHWQSSIINHLYWCVVSTPNGNSELIKAKRLSLDMFRMCIKGTTIPSQTVHMGSYMAVTEKRSGLNKRRKHSLIIVYYNIRSLCSEFKYFRFQELNQNKQRLKLQKEQLLMGMKILHSVKLLL